MNSNLSGSISMFNIYRGRKKEERRRKKEEVAVGCVALEKLSREIDNLVATHPTMKIIPFCSGRN
ncbi:MULTISPECIES: hypothetical protein [unclassified Microcoleus]|uniref:hypothetical protein n=2 Tax=Microcoleus TaxID=44471 RepID=UPI002FD38925